MGGNTLNQSLKINAGSTRGTKMGNTPLTGSTLYYKFGEVMVVNDNLTTNRYMLNNETYTYNGLVIKVVIDSECQNYNIITPTGTPTPTPTSTPY
jgi:hypothetical protein